MVKPSKSWARFKRFAVPSYWVEFSRNGVMTFSPDLAGELNLSEGVVVLFNESDRVLAVRAPLKGDAEDGAVLKPDAAAKRPTAVYARAAMSEFGLSPQRLVMHWDNGLLAWTGIVP